jgi:tRNA(Ile2) C34 agmatinyltransferase TiaS
MEVPIAQKPSKRICLICNKPFDSTGAGNRRCPKCEKNRGRKNDIDMKPMRLSREAH